MKVGIVVRVPVRLTSEDPQQEALDLLTSIIRAGLEVATIGWRVRIEPDRAFGLIEMDRSDDATMTT